MKAELMLNDRHMISQDTFAEMAGWRLPPPFPGNQHNCEYPIALIVDGSCGPMAIREVARRVKRDVTGVHGDVQLLLTAWILRKTDKGQIAFPFDVVHVDFTLKAA